MRNINQKQLYKPVFFSIVFILCSMLIIGATSYSAIADENQYQKDIETIERISGRYGERDLIIEALNEIATSEKISVEEAAHNEAYAMKHRGYYAPATRSGGGGRKLVEAQNVGDFFYTPGGIGNHGHVGIYVKKCKIVEAPIIWAHVHNVKCENVSVNSGAILRSVKTSQANRDKAAKRAEEKYVGRGYNDVFLG